MWKYIGYRNAYRGWLAYWSNVASGGMDVAVSADCHDNGDNDWLTNTPEPNAEILYGALNDYNGDIIAYCEANGITREAI